ncbi:MAG TPA: hypothetical protein PLL71_06185, partial [Agriterribacter sp.]|nr:hypothetical protein [Agriterribacter sp.]
MKKRWLPALLLCAVVYGTAYPQLPPVFHQTRQSQSTATVIRYLSPVNILWQTENATANIIHEQRLLKPGNGQADLSNRDMCILKSDAKVKPAL